MTFGGCGAVTEDGDTVWWGEKKHSCPLWREHAVDEEKEEV